MVSVDPNRGYFLYKSLDPKTMNPMSNLTYVTFGGSNNFPKNVKVPEPIPTKTPDSNPDPTFFSSSHIPSATSDLTKLTSFRKFDHRVFFNLEMVPIITQLMSNNNAQSQDLITHMAKGLFRSKKGDLSWDDKAKVYSYCECDSKCKCFHYHFDDCDPMEMIKGILEKMPSNIFEYLMLNFVQFNPIISQLIHKSDRLYGLIKKLSVSPKFPLELHFLLEKCEMMSTNLDWTNLEILIKRGTVKTIELVLENLKKITKLPRNTTPEPFLYAVKEFEKIDLRSDFSKEDKEKLNTTWKALIADWNERHSKEGIVLKCDLRLVLDSEFFQSMDSLKRELDRAEFKKTDRALMKVILN